MRVMEYARAMGFDMIQGDHEDAPGQLELNWMYDDVLRNADRLSTTDKFVHKLLESLI